MDLLSVPVNRRETPFGKHFLRGLQQPIERFTLPLGLQFFQATLSAGEAPRWHLMMAMSTLMVIPVVILFFLAQRQFIDGIQVGGVKG